MDTALTVSLKRTAELCAIFVVGNGVVSLLQSDRHLRLWRSDMPLIDGFTRADREGAAAWRRAHALLNIGGGLLLASALRQKE